MNPLDDPGPGRIAPLLRRFDGAPDALALYAALSDGGARPHTALLESADAATGIGERTLLMARAAAHLEADLEEVRVTATSPNGMALIAWLAATLPEAQLLEAGRLLVAPQRRAPEAIRNERERFRSPSPLDLLRRVIERPRLVSDPAPWCHLAIGCLGYDLIDYFEVLPAGAPDPLRQPVLEWWVPDELLVLDHLRNQVSVVACAWGGERFAERFHDASRAIERLTAVACATAPSTRPSAPPPVAVPAELSDGLDADGQAYAEVVAGLKARHRSGAVYQIVPSRTFTAPCPDPLAAYARLRAMNPSPYLFYLRSPSRVLFGASPETCLRIDGDSGRVSIRPIAGTAARGRSADGRLDHELDARLEAALRADAKEMAEHLMLVDLARNDVARISVPGTRLVSRLLTVERYSHVMHLVSEVAGTLRPGIDALEAYAATMNMGTLVGAPKLRAAAILREVEPSRRGCYGGAVGYLTQAGTLETAIVIRSAVVANGVAHVRAGAGIVLDSDPVAEAWETARKAQAVLAAIGAEELAHA